MAQYFTSHGQSCVIPVAARRCCVMVVWLGLFALCGCITSLDQRVEVVEAEIGEVESFEWLSARVGGEWTSPRTGFYRVRGGGESNVTAWSGATQLIVPESGAWFPLQAGDRLRVSDGASAVGLMVDEAADRSWRTNGSTSRLVSVTEGDRGYSVEMTESTPIRVMRRILRKEWVPRSYSIGDESWSPEEVDGAQALTWILFSPLEVGRLLTRLFGGRLIREPDWELVVLPQGERELGSGDLSILGDVASEAWSNTLVRVVGDASLAVELVFASSDESSKSINWDMRLEQASHGVSVPGAYRDMVESCLDFGRYGRLTIKDGPGGDLFEETVDLIRLLGL